MIEWEAAYQRMLLKRSIMATGCWHSLAKARVWHSSGLGYPVIRVRVGSTWKQYKFVRVVAEVVGISGAGLQILHNCNNPECWNPQHLRWGTHSQNMRDKIAAGTSLAGEKHNLVKLTNAQVNEIRLRGKRQEPHRQIAEDYPVNRRQISRIISGTRWS
jgi:hypothetical protein